jgi:hypothetical protein
LELRNRSPYLAGYVVLFDKEGAEQLCVTIRGTWDIGPRGTLERAAKPPPFSPLDTHYGEPGKSSVKHEGDAGYPKLATDVALIGSAVAHRSGTTKMEVGIRVGPCVARALVVGPRVLSGGRPTSPRPFDVVPLKWELAAGGNDETPTDQKDHGHEARNPLGLGFRAQRSRLPVDGTLLPQIVVAEGNDVDPVGFGYIGEGWLPRRQYAGTYDEVWQKTRMPILPLDFDERFHNRAAPGLVAPGHLRGGEPVEVVGCTPEGRLSFALPAELPVAVARIGEATQPVAVTLATVAVDCEAMQLRMSWRGSLRIHGKLPLFKRLAVTLPGWTAPNEKAPKPGAAA